MTIVETLVESWYDVCYLIERRRVFALDVTIVETLVESLYDVCYVMECRRVFIRRLS